MSYNVEIREVNTSLRGVISESYTLTQREGLKLFELAVWDENNTPFELDAPASDELNWLFESQRIEFWATSEEKAYDELCAHLKAFHNAGLTRYDDKEDPFQCDKCIAWFNHYNTFDFLVIPEGTSKVETINAVISFERHCVYVLRKMCELVDLILENIGPDFYYSIVDGED